MAETPSELAAAIAELDDGYLRLQLLLAVRRASTDEPRRAGLWHALAGLLAAEQQRRAETGAGRGEADTAFPEALVAEVREELRLDAEALALEPFEPDAT